MREDTTLERCSHTVQGDRAELIVEDGHVTIVKESATQLRPTRVTFAIAEVRHATLRAPSRGAPGWLHVDVVGGSPTPPSELAATGDPYTVLLRARRLAAARKLVRMIDDHVRRRGLPSDGPSAHPGVTLTDAEPSAHRPRTRTVDAPEPATARVRPASTLSPERMTARDEHLRQLVDLHRAGVLTDEEFDHARRRLLTA